MNPADRPRRLPPWMKRPLPAPAATARVRATLSRLALHTVCEGAHCPNLPECFACGTATFMILGDTCTRSCRFCAIGGRGSLAPPRADEPTALAQAAAELGLRHVVITSVTRDDLADGGAEHFARTIRAVREALPAASVEVLTPDFAGDDRCVDAVLGAHPDVFNHNIETVERLSASLRPQAGYARSLAVLRRAATVGEGSGLFIKSGLMLGLGEREEEILATLRDLLVAGCRVLTLGQYLAPSPSHAPVERFVEPDEFDRLAAAAREMGFAAVAAGPFVRSSYHAAQMHAQHRP